MLPDKLPLTIKPEQLCKTAPVEGYLLAGELFFSELNSFSAELPQSSDARVRIALTFMQDENGLCCVRGELSANLSMTCQRCLKPMVVPVDAQILVSPVISDLQASQLPDYYEPLMVAEGEIRLAEWIAEELHLALPFVPLHDTPCMSHPAEDLNRKEEEGEVIKDSPFKKLKILKC